MQEKRHFGGLVRKGESDAPGRTRVIRVSGSGRWFVAFSPHENLAKFVSLVGSPVVNGKSLPAMRNMTNFHSTQKTFANNRPIEGRLNS